MSRIAAVFLGILLAPATSVAGALPFLDPSFGDGGLVEIEWPAGAARAGAVGIDAAGRLLVGGSATGPFGDDDFVLFRLHADGTRDVGYAADGGGCRVLDFDLDGLGGRSDDAVNAIVVQADGALVALGEAHFGFAGINAQVALARLDAAGMPDPGFGRGGLAHFGFDSFAAIDSGLRLAADAAGRLLVGARVARFVDGGSTTLEWQVGLARLTPQGTFDPTFEGGGRYTATFWVDPAIPPPRYSSFNVPLALAHDTAGRIVVGGVVAQPLPTDGAVYRAPPDGGFDDGFGDHARVQLGLAGGEASAVHPLADGGLFVAGGHATDSGYALFLARLRNDGSRDPAFGSDGLVSLPLAEGYPEPSLIAPMRDGGWLVAGRLGGTDAGGLGVVLARFHADGTPDERFGEGGIARVDVADGRRFDAAGVALQDDGRLVAAGRLPALAPDATTHFALLRIDLDDGVFADGFEIDAQRQPTLPLWL